MPLSTVLDRHPIIGRGMGLRKKPPVAYGIAIVLVALATLAHWAVTGPIMDGRPFVTYYLAIVLAALLGGFRPGVLATVLSALAGWYFFVTSSSGWMIGSQVAVSLPLFTALSLFNVTVVSLLNMALLRMTEQGENLRILIESSPTGKPRKANN